MSATMSTFECYINQADSKYGRTALHLGCMNPNTNIVKKLLAFPGINVNVKDYTGKTPLHYACEHGYTDNVKALTSVHGIKTNIRSKRNGYTPLHYACEQGHEEMVKELLTVDGIAVNIRNSNNMTAFDIATINGFVDIVKMLEQYN